MSCHWQYVMNCFDPIALTIGSFQIYWYAFFFLLAWQGAFRTLLFLERSGEVNQWKIEKKQWEDIAWIILLGAFLGGRIGFVLFYAPEYFLQHMSQIFIPYDFVQHTWLSLRGMSFHGGLIGVALALAYYCRTEKISFLTLTDKLVVVVPIASFFGRLGNFFNQELPGKVTTQVWGVVFPGESVLRHPVTLYSAFLEGVFLLGWMLFWKKFLKKKGDMTFFYLVSYGIVRFVIEFWREPDRGVTLFLNAFSQGQVLSILLIVGGLLCWFFRSKYATIEST